MLQQTGHWTKIIIPAFVTLMIGIIVGRGMPANPTQQKVNITFPGGSKLEMDTSQPELAHSTLLELIFSESFTRDGALGWLQRQSIFSIDDERIADAIANNLCDPIPDFPLTKKIEKAKECAEKPVVNRLRRLAEQKSPPFHYVGIEVDIGVQAEGDAKPASKRANVCQNSELYGKDIELTEVVSGRQAVVHASGYYNCTGFSKFPDIQLNPVDAKNLFQRSLQEYQSAIAVVLD